MSDLETMLHDVGLRDIELNGDDIASNIGSILFGLRTQRAGNGIAIALGVMPRMDGPKIPDDAEGLFASKIIFPDVTIAFWAQMRVVAAPEADHVVLQCSDFLLRDIAVLGSDQTFDEFVAEASAMSGLGLVIKTETLNLSGSAEPEVASDLERNGDRPRASQQRALV